MPIPTKAATLLALLGSSGAAASDSCQCLNWKDLYSSKLAGSNAPRVQCGEGLEFMQDDFKDSHTRLEIAEIQGRPFGYVKCSNFYEKLDNNYCTNVANPPPDQAGWYGGTWCYVSNECQNLNGGKRLADGGPGAMMEWFQSFITDASLMIKGDASWKVCRPPDQGGTDVQLRDLSLEDIFAMADKYGLLMNAFIKQALYNSWAIWPAVEDAFNAKKTDELPESMQVAASRNLPIVVDEQWGGGGNLKIVRGNDVWTLEFGTEEDCGPTFFCRHKGDKVPEGSKTQGGAPSHGGEL